MQLIKDANHPYSTTRSCNPFSDGSEAAPEIPQGEVSDGHWNLTPESIRRLKNDPYAQSHRLLADELEMMRLFNINYWAIERVFLNDEVGDNEYERLREAAGRHEAQLKERINKNRRKSPSAKELVQAYIEGRTREMKLFAAVEMAIHDLTMRLMDKELHVVFPERVVKTTNRRKTMEESYREIHRVFADWCEDLSKKHKRFRSKAYDNTAVNCSVSRATVERAVHFVEAGEEQSATPTRCGSPKAAKERRHLKKEGRAA